MAEKMTADQWLDRFFDWYYRANPVSATFIGVHQHDRELPSPDARSVHTGLGELLDALENGDVAAPGDTAEEIDLLLAGACLRVTRQEQRSEHLLRNPCYYTGEAVFGIVSLFLRDFAPIDVRLDAAVERLRLIPALLDAGSRTIELAPQPWIDRAIKECDGAERLLRDGLPVLVSRSSDPRHDVIDAGAVAAQAFEVFREQLKSRGTSSQNETVAIGRDEFDWLLREAHFLAMTGDEIVTYARQELLSARDALERGIAEQGHESWDDVADALASQHPMASDYYARFPVVWEAARQHSIERELLTWPDFPIVFEPIPDWAITAAPSLYFLFYRCPPPFDDGQVQRYLVTPLGDEPERVLRAVNETQISLNHVIHHAGIGHHVQNWHAARAQSRVGRIAGNDCSMRIAMHSAGTLVEGWACYATDLMEEAGFLSPLQQLSMLHSRMRMAARAIVDVELHAGRFSMDDATEFYVREVDMSPEAAKSEAVKNSMFPTMAMMYLIGTDLIHELREDMHVRWGNEFSLRRFHDEFLSWGAIPVTQIARLMRGEPLAPGGLSGTLSAE